MKRTISGLLLTLTLLGASAVAHPSPAAARPTAEPEAPAALTAARGPVAKAAAKASGGPLKAVLRKVNKARARHDLKPLKLHTCLTTKFAQPWAVQMARTGKFEHQGLGPILRQCSFSTAGENIAYGYPTAAAVMKAWMNSDGHRANILRKGFRRIGLGLATTSSGTRYWVQDFGG